MLHLTKTRVMRSGAFWVVQRQFCGQWETMRDLFSTKSEATKQLHYWAQR